MLNNWTYTSVFELESGKKIPSLTLTYHTYGKINENKDNVVWAFHAFTANSDVMDWWKGLFGEKDFFNPNDYFIICVNVLGSPYGSTAPKDLNFPDFTVRDVVQSQIELANALKINHIKIAIGGSFGGSQALEFSYLFQGKIDNLILIASAAKESAWGIAIHTAQRLALKSDVTFGEINGGKSGLKTARAIGLLTYRTPELFVEQQSDSNDTIENFKASSYINYQGDKFVKRFNALSYYYLQNCLDTHNIGRNRGGIPNALNQIKIKTLVISIDTDQLLPVSMQKELHNYLENSTFKIIESKFGHDGFLIETEKIEKEIIKFINE